MLGMTVGPGLWVTLIPIGIVVLSLITFEISIAVTISTLPRSRFQQKWTPQEQRRVLRVFGTIFSVWPITAALIIAHVYLPFGFALVADALVLMVIALGIRWLLQGVKQRKLILAGHCANCLYDLRASQESNHCPECGIERSDHPSRVIANRPGLARSIKN